MAFEWNSSEDGPVFTIREATNADLSEILARWAELLAAHAELHPRLYATAPHAHGTYHAFLRRKLDEPRQVVLVACAERKVVGYAVGGMGQRAAIFRIRDVGMVYDLVVTPRWRRRGVARALADSMLERFRSWGLSHAQVSYSPDNPSASTFWPAIGFAPFLAEAYKPLD